MRRAGLIVALGFSLCFGPALIAQRAGGIELHGTPASVTSPTIDGRLRGSAASVTDPGFGAIHQFRGAANVGHGHRGHDRDVRPVYVVPYYGYYAGFNDSAQYDESQQQPAQAQVVEEKKEATDQPEDSSRYGEHYFDGRESRRDLDEDRVVAQAKPVSTPAPVADNSPMTTLVYRDGHKSEVRNYAIVGSNLIDLTKSPVLKKIPLDSLDLVATRKENEDNGVDFHTP